MNEPVAYWDGKHFASKDKSSLANIPLYTHPIKEKGLPLSSPSPMNQAFLTRSDNNTPIAWSCWSEGMQAAIVTTTEPDMYGWQSIIPLFSHPVKELTDEEIIESLAELEHEQWMKWADTIMQTEKISDSRFARWASCMIPYADLTEEMKEFDRVWARKALAILRKAQE